MAFDPYNAINPTITPPMAGTKITNRPYVLVAGREWANENWWWKERFVIRLMS
jgi:hypothetical protein